MTQHQRRLLNDAITRYIGDDHLLVDLIGMTRAQQKAALMPYLDAIRAERAETVKNVEAMALEAKRTAQNEIDAIDSFAF